MAATDATPVPMKGVAYRVTFPIYDADGDLVTSAAGLDSEVDKDAAGYNDCANEATEIGSSGTYYLDLTATEMNADTVSVLVKTSTSGAKTTVLVLYPEEAGNIRATSLLSVGTGAGQLNVASGKAPVTLAAADVTGNLAADLQTIKARAVTDPGAGVAIGTNVAQVGSNMGSAASVTAGVTLAADQAVDVTKWKGATAPAMTGDAYARLGAPSGASVSADVAAVKSDAAAILADTGTDGVLVATAAKTGYALTSAYDAAKASASQTSVNDLPTNAELATALAGADDATLAAIAALNNLSSAQAQSAAAAALAAYDPPTKAELDSGLAAADDAVLAVLGVAGAGLTALGDTRLANLDAAVSTRSTYAGGAVASVTGNVGGNVAGSVGSVASPVTAGTVSDKTGYTLTGAYDLSKTAAQAGDAMALTSGERTTLVGVIWAALTSGLSTVGSIGKRIVDYLTGDTFARIGANGAGLTAIGDTRVANLDAAVSTRLATSGYTAPPSAATVASATRVELATELDRLDAAVTTRLASASYTAPDNADVVLIKTVTDRLIAMVEDAGTYDRWLDTALEEAPTGGAGTAPTVQQIDAQLTSTHGAGSWQSSTGGSGEFVQTLTVTDGTNTLPGIWLSIYNAAETSLIAGPMMTDADGVAAPTLDAGTYHILVKTTPAYEPQAPQTLVVTEADSATIELTAVVIAPPVDPTLCRVYGKLVSGGGIPKVAEIRFYAVTSGTQDNILVSRDFVLAVSDATGYVEVDLVHSATYKVTSEYYIEGFKTIVIPGSSVGTASLEALLDAAV